MPHFPSLDGDLCLILQPSYRMSFNWSATQSMIIGRAR